MAKSKSRASMSVDALLKMRDDVGYVLSKRMNELQRQLASMAGSAKRGRKAGALKGRRIVPKYKGPGGQTWAGRGATPRWMADAINAGAKKEDFLIAGAAKQKTAGRRPRKAAA